MRSNFLLYGANGFLGRAIARLAVQGGLRPLLAGRDEEKIRPLADELGLEHRSFDLGDNAAMDRALADVSAVLHCAGPFLYTSKRMLAGCLRTGTHYLDLTGEIPVYEALATHDTQARARGIMILPGVGYDVVPTDCLAVYLKQRLPAATRLTIGFRNIGPAPVPPGTAATMLEMIPYGICRRRNGRLERLRRATSRMIDFGAGPVLGTLMTWGDIYMAFRSTGIPNIEVFAVFPPPVTRQMAVTNAVRGLFKLAVVRRFLRRGLTSGPTAEQLAQTRNSIWAEVEDDHGRKAAARLHGPEAGVVWASRAALAAVRRVLAGQAPVGFQTPALAYGADFVLDCEGVTRESVA